MRFSLLLALVPLGCSVATPAASSQDANETESTAITIAATPGAAVQGIFLVSGAAKTPAGLPSPNDSACGASVHSVLSYDPESFAYVEVKNPGDSAASVAVSLDGTPDLSTAFFAYTSPKAPASIDEVKTCTVSSGGDAVGGTIRGAELSSRRGTGLVVPAHGSAYVMLATDSKTGAFPVTVTTEAVGAADKVAVTISPAVDASVTSSVLVSGATKSPAGLPAPTDWACGGSGHSVRSYDPESIAYVEVKNPGDGAASIALSLDGAPDMNLAFFAYTSPNAPTSLDQVKTCTVSVSGGFLAGGPTFGPELSSRRGTGLVVPAHGSAYVMFATGSKTGPFGLIAKTEALGPADRASITIPDAPGAGVTQEVLVSGATTTPAALPSPGDWTCGGAGQSVRSYDPEHFAYVEVKNPGDGAASVALSLDGTPDASLAFFAYASPNPPASLDEVKACTVASSGEYVGGTAAGPELSSRRGTGLVVPAHGSAYVMLATGSKTGPFPLKLVRE